MMIFGGSTVCRGFVHRAKATAPKLPAAPTTKTRHNGRGLISFKGTPHSRSRNTHGRSERVSSDVTHIIPVIAASLAAGLGLWHSSNHKTYNDAPRGNRTEARGDDDPLLDLSRLSDLWKQTTYPALNLDDANAKLKSGELSILTGSAKSDADPTRVDVASLASNHPKEDTMSFVMQDIGDSRPWMFCGVYDGHAGWATSHVLQDTLSLYVSREIRQTQMTGKIQSFSPEAVQQAIKQGFLKLDDEIMSRGLKAVSDACTHAEAINRMAPARAGSCALLATIDPANSTLYVACTGDSRAVLGRRSSTPAPLSKAPSNPPEHSPTHTYTAEALSTDHTGHNEEEQTRIAHDHPDESDAIDTKSGRLLGLAVTRAFGDHRWKWPLEAVERCQSNFYGPSPRPKYLSPPYLTAEPVVTTTKVHKGDFLILATDGLWDHMSSEDAVKCVDMWLNGQENNDGESAVTTPSPSRFDYYYKSTPEHFVVEDDNVATHLVRNALGGSRRELFCSVMTMQAPESRMARDDITVQVVFFGDVSGEGGQR